MLLYSFVRKRKSKLLSLKTNHLTHLGVNIFLYIGDSVHWHAAGCFRGAVIRDVIHPLLQLWKCRHARSQLWPQSTSMELSCDRQEAHLKSQLLFLTCFIWCAVTLIPVQFFKAAQCFTLVHSYGREVCTSISLARAAAGAGQSDDSGDRSICSSKCF